MRLAALLLLAAMSSPVVVSAQTADPLPTAPATDLVRVTITTALGPIVIAVDRTDAPATSANFLRYVDAKRLDGTVFYRALRAGDGLGFVQFGTSGDPRRTFPPIAHEPTSKTGLSHTDGAISMAMTRPGTAAGDFFVIVGDLHSYDATGSDPGYAVFGHVVEGMDVVRRILAAPTSPTRGEGVMRGQMLEPGIKIVSARRG